MAVLSFIPVATPIVEPMATSSSPLQKISPKTAGMKRTAAHPLPNRASNGSMRVVNSSRRMRPAKNSPPRMRLRPKQSPPCSPSERLDLYTPSAVPSRYPPSTHVAVMVIVASQIGIARPATRKSSDVPCLPLSAERPPITRKTAKMMISETMPTSRKRLRAPF